MKQLKLIMRIIKEHSALSILVPMFCEHLLDEIFAAIGGWTRSGIHSVIDTIINYLSHM